MIYDGWYLLDRHRNRHSTQTSPAGDPNTRPWYTTRRNVVTAIVIHTPETLEDFTAPYDEAERVAQYGASTTRASWHDTIDADSIIPMLPGSYTAWQTRGYNSRTIGMEIGAKATSWNRAPSEWVTGVLENAAQRARQHADEHGIPPRFITRSQVDAGERGFTSHAQLDPERRTDPGRDFPWDRFLSLVEGEEMKPPNWAREATQWHIDNDIYTERSPDDVDEDLEFHRQTVFRHRFYLHVVRGTGDHEHDARYVRRGTTIELP